MKQIISIIFLFCTITLCAKTRYVAFNDITMNIEVYDSLNHVTHEYLNTHEEYLIKDVNDFQVTVYSVPVSDEENKAIKSAKAAKGWATAAMIASAASAVANAASSASHTYHHRYSWWHHHDMLILSHMNLLFSAELRNNAVKALNELQNFEGTAMIITNNSMNIKSVFVDGIQYFIAPKDTKAFNVNQNNTVLIIKDNNTITKILANASREVKKISYAFSDNEFYYTKVKINGEVKYQQLPKTNIQNPHFIDQTTYDSYKAYSKTLK